MVRLISRQRRGLAALKLTKLFGIDDFPAAKDSGKVLIIIIYCYLIIIIIRCVFSSLSIGRESTTWPANNCLQIIVCSCVAPSKRGLLQIIFCSCVMGTTFSREKWQIAFLSCQEVIKIWKQSWWSNDKTIIDSVITKYHDLSVSRRSIICLSLRLRQIIHLLASDKSRYFAKPCPTIVNYFYFHHNLCWCSLCASAGCKPCT